MTTIYQKTRKGLIEITTREHRLAPRLRTALILVDGKRDADTLHHLIQIQAETTLQSLLDQGFIEIATIGSSHFPITQPTPLQPVQPYVHSAPAPLHPDAAHKPVKTFDSVRRDVVHVLNDLLGPDGEMLSIKIERVKTFAELRPLLEMGQQIIRNAHGADAATSFGKRFIDHPPHEG